MVHTPPSEGGGRKSWLHGELGVQLVACPHPVAPTRSLVADEIVAPLGAHEQSSPPALHALHAKSTDAKKAGIQAMRAV